MDLTTLYPLLTVATFALTAGARQSPFWQRIPSRWRWLVPVAFTAIETSVDALVSGRDWRASVGIGAAAAGSAIAAHHGMKAYR